MVVVVVAVTALALGLFSVAAVIDSEAVEAVNMDVEVVNVVDAVVDAVAVETGAEAVAVETVAVDAVAVYVVAVDVVAVDAVVEAVVAKVAVECLEIVFQQQVVSEHKENYKKQVRKVPIEVPLEG